MNHFLQMFVDGYNKKIDVLEVSLDPGYSRCLQMDFVNRRCRVVCRKENKPEYINVPKMIEPDFPDLNRLKEKVSMYVVFS